MSPESSLHLPLPQDASVVVVGTARDCERSVRAEVHRLERATRAFRRRRVLVVESDSSDCTSDVLVRVGSEISGFRHISLGKLQPRIPGRSERIAYCRNAYLEELRSDARYRDVDYVIVADLDGANASLDAMALATCWAPSVESWDVCTANQRGPYSDIWALRHAVWCPGDCWESYRALEPILGARLAMGVAVHSKMIRIPSDAPTIRVTSAFGGLAVYRAAALLTGEYRGVRDDGVDVCEHVPLHEALVARGHRVLINPALINAGVTFHAAAATTFHRAVREMRALAEAVVRCTGTARQARRIQRK